MSTNERCLVVALALLDESVCKATALFPQLDETLYDGHQSAREVLSHLVYWHSVYCRVAAALQRRRRPALPQGTFAELNARAAHRYRHASPKQLSRRLRQHQRRLAAYLRHLPDVNGPFPIKRGARSRSVVARVQAIAQHINGHVARLERAERHGQAWVEAYYPDEPDGSNERPQAKDALRQTEHALVTG